MSPAPDARETGWRLGSGSPLVQSRAAAAAAADAEARGTAGGPQLAEAALKETRNTHASERGRAHARARKRAGTRRVPIDFALAPGFR